MRRFSVLSARRLGAALMLLCVLWGTRALAQEPSLRGYTKEDGWQYVELGTYPQTLDHGLEPILWRVLAAQNGEAYLVSEYVLCHRRLHSDDAEYVLGGGDFAKTEMYAYLNSDFLDGFSVTERALISGPVTLLSAEDLKNADYGFSGDVSRRAWGTPYALQNGLFQYSSQFGSASPYWTRTQNPKSAYAASCTKAKGNLGWIRVVVQNLGCRPACTLSLGERTFPLGDGTMDNPFRFK